MPALTSRKSNTHAISSVRVTRRRLAAHFAEHDPVMAALIEAAGPFRLRPLPCPSPFRHLTEAIISQQISGRAAAAIRARFSGVFSLRDSDFPQPEDVLAQPDSALRGAGLSAAKVAAIRDLSRKTVDGIVPDSRTLLSLSDQEIIERLTIVRGIGPWTVQMMLMFQLGRRDILPIADYGVRNGFRIAYRKRLLPTPGELARYGERWAPYRSAAAWYLWRVVDLEKAGVEWPRPRIRTSVAALRGDASARRRRSGARTR
jgi:DNA-3-methyladenine glycosylase II